jgi:hypothetical protein
VSGWGRGPPSRIQPDKSLSDPLLPPPKNSKVGSRKNTKMMLKSFIILHAGLFTGVRPFERLCVTCLSAVCLQLHRDAGPQVCMSGSLSWVGFSSGIVVTGSRHEHDSLGSRNLLRPRIPSPTSGAVRREEASIAKKQLFRLAFRVYPTLHLAAPQASRLPGVQACMQRDIVLLLDCLGICTDGLGRP